MQDFGLWGYSPIFGSGRYTKLPGTHVSTSNTRTVESVVENYIHKNPTTNYRNFLVEYTSGTKEIIAHVSVSVNPVPQITTRTDIP